MIDQMVQAARSGRQNIAEGSRAAATSSQTELRLVNVARANALICLIHQTNYLLDQQIAALEKQFVEEGGYSEQLAAKLLQHRSDQTDQTDFPPCPQCGKPMVLRTAKTGQSAGKQFLGCSGYPDCKGVKDL